MCGLKAKIGFNSGNQASSNNPRSTVAGSVQSQQSWARDAAGNQGSVNTDGTAARTVNSQNQATAVGANTLTYDDAGNTITGYDLLRRWQGHRHAGPVGRSQQLGDSTGWEDCRHRLCRGRVSNDFGVARFNVDGTLDTTFDTDGFCDGSMHPAASRAGVIEEAGDDLPRIGRPEPRPVAHAQCQTSAKQRDLPLDSRRRGWSNLKRASGSGGIVARCISSAFGQRSRRRESLNDMQGRGEQELRYHVSVRRRTGRTKVVEFHLGLERWGSSRRFSTAGVTAAMRAGPMMILIPLSSAQRGG